MHLLFLILDIGVDQQRVGLTEYVLHSYLKAVEAPGLWRCDLRREVPAEVLDDYAIGRGEERKDVESAIRWGTGCPSLACPRSGRSPWQSRMKPRPVYTFSKCCRVEWGRGQHDLGLSGGAVREQDSRSCRQFFVSFAFVRFSSLWRPS